MNESLAKTTPAELPAVYQRAIVALETCESIDECKGWADKASALASYARQAEDEVLLSHVLRIRARALRRCGELLKTFQTGPKGGAPTKNNGTAADTVISQRQAAEQAGMSKRQEVTAVRVADVPVKVFEAAVESEHPPTVTKLATMGRTPARNSAVRRSGKLKKSAPLSGDTRYKQALDEARAWMAKWGHISTLAPICDAITQCLERKDE